jgi:hypothetical protein
MSISTSCPYNNNNNNNNNKGSVTFITINNNKNNNNHLSLAGCSGSSPSSFSGWPQPP